jgi:hypothetical protein
LDQLEASTADAGHHLKGLSRLERLTLTGTEVTDAGVRELRKALPKLGTGR